MKVYDLGCGNQHRFEGWFGSDDDFASQAERGLIECPLCGDTKVLRLPSSPRLNLAAAQEKTEPVAQGPDAQALFLQAVRRVLDSTEDVGERFPEEARRIHYGETPERGIRGRATRADSEALREEGIEVWPLPVPPALRGPVQ